MNTIDYLARKVAMNAAFGITPTEEQMTDMGKTFFLNTNSFLTDKEASIFSDRVAYHALDFMGGPEGLSVHDREQVTKAVASVFSLYKDHGRGIVEGEPRKDFAELGSRFSQCRGAFYLLPDGKEVVRCQAALPEYDGVLLDGFRERLSPMQAVDISFRALLEDMKKSFGYEHTYLGLENDNQDGLSYRHGELYYVRRLPDGVSTPLSQIPDEKLSGIFDAIGSRREEVRRQKEKELNKEDTGLEELLLQVDSRIVHFEGDERPVVALIPSGDSVRIDSIWVSNILDYPLVSMVAGNRTFDERTLSDSSVSSLKDHVYRYLDKHNMLGNAMNKGAAESKSSNKGFRK